MADQTKNLILKLKLETDTSSGQTIVKLIKDQVGAVAEVAKASEKLIQLDTSRKAILQGHLDQVKLIDAAIKAQLDKQAQPLKDLETKIAKANKTLAAHGRGWNFAADNIAKAVASHNKYQEVLDKEVATQLEIYRIQRLQAVEQVAKAKSYSLTGAATGTTTPAATRPVGGFNYGTGTGGAATLDSNLALVRNFNEATGRIEQQAAARRVATFNSSLSEQEARMRSSIDIQTAEQVHGINSVQAQRARANEATRQAEQTLQAQLNAIRASVASGRTSPTTSSTATAVAMRQYTDSIVSSNNALHTHEQAIASTTERHRNLFIRVGEAIGAYRIWNTTINLVATSLQAIPRIGIELDSIKASLEATVGSSAGMSSMLSTLAKEADRTGINLGILRDNFKGFQASTSLAGASLESTWKMFTNLDTVITGLHLPAEKANGVFLAMAQIFNKGKVQSEELVKQLGNLLPGAFASFAASMKILPEELSKRMKQGTVYAKDTMVEFTNFMVTRFEPAFALASQGLNANIGRMQNSFILLGETIYGETSTKMLSVVKTITSMTTSVTGLLNGTETLSDSLKVGLSVTLGLVAVGLANVVIKAYEAINVIKILGVTTAFFNPLAIAITAIGAGMYYWYQQANNLIKPLESVNNSYRAMIEHQTELNNLKNTSNAIPTIDLQAEKDVEVIKGKAEVIKAQKALEDASRTPDIKQPDLGGKTQLEAAQESLKYWSDYYHERQRIAKEDLTNAKAEEEARIKLANATSIDDIVEKHKSTLGKFAKSSREAADYAESKLKTGAWIKDIEELRAVVSKSEDAKLAIGLKPSTNQVADAKATIAKMDEEIYRARKDAVDSFNKSSESGAKAAGAGERRDNYKDIIRDSKDATLAIEDDLLRLDYARQDQVMSVQDFYNQKKALQDKDYQQQIAATNRLLAIAKSSGDTAGVEKYNDLLREKAQAQVKLEEIGKRTYVVESRAYALQLIDNKAKDASNKLVTESDNINNRYLSGLTTEADYITEVTGLKLKEIEIIKEKNRGLQEQLMLQGELAQSPLEKIKLRQDIEANKAQILAKAAPSGLGKDITTRFGTSGLGSFATSSMKASSEQSTLENDRQLALGAVTLDPNMQALEAHKKFTADKAKINEDYNTKSKLLNLDYYAGTAAMAATAAESMTSIAIKAYGAQSKQAKVAFLAYKMLKIAEIIMDTAALATRLALSQASIPILGIPLAVAAVPIAYAIGAIQLAAVMAAPMPAAHGGMTNVPSEQTYLLDKGERVLSPNQNKDFTNFLKEGKKESGQSGGNVYNIAVTVQSTKDQNPAELGSAISMSIMRNIAKEEISSASRPGNSLNKTTSFS